MKRLPALLIAVRESFWLLPSIGLGGALLLATTLVEIDATVGPDLAVQWPRLFGAGAAGARGTLTAIAGSMITVAGVVFSVTIVALSLAASAYSPRVLRTFTSDRGMQAAFGVFVGVFAYCLVVLRTVRGAGEDDKAFVPSLAVFGALVLALLAVLVLVYFIHHLATTLQISTILQRIATETRKTIERLFPEELGEDENGDVEPHVPEGAWRAIPARRSGYVMSVDAAGLLSFARDRGVVLRMDIAVGEFAVECQPLVSITRGARGDPQADAQELDRLYVLGPERNLHQDAAFGIQQLVDVAVRALSSGVNDPSTAVLCIDHLGALLVSLARRRVPSPRRSEDGELRVLARGPDFESLARLALEPIARHARRDPTVLAALARAARRAERAAGSRRAVFMSAQVQAIEARLLECGPS